VGDLDNSDDDGLLFGSLEDGTTLGTLVGSDEEEALVGSDDVGYLYCAKEDGALVGSLYGTTLETLKELWEARTTGDTCTAPKTTEP
jgi:hypothetical protein